MTKGVLWVSAVGLIGITATGIAAPALAKGSVGGGFHAGAPAAHPGATPNHAGFTRSPIRATASLPRTPRPERVNPGHDSLRYGLPLGVLPYYPAFEDIPIVQTTAAQPRVIVVSGAASAPSAPPTPADFSFVAGCRPIANGYHCDPPHQ